VAAAELERGTTVIEVGAGRGALTEALADAGMRVVALEIDRELAPLLRERFASTADVTVMEADVLARAPGELLAAAGAAAPYAVVANLPYNIAAAVVRRFLEATQAPFRMVVLVQREVAEAMCARRGAMSLLSVAVQVYGDARIVMRVARGAFVPAPRVDSSVVRIDVAARPKVDVPLDAFFTVARAGFAQPRKQLRNGLAGGLGVPAAKAEALLAEASVPATLRPQALTVADWGRLARAWSEQP
jgi:16S rRNA (adenine1518-N6/adenine1519-N6)-dimethyltransferase